MCALQDRVIDQQPLVRPAHTTVPAATQAMSTQRGGALRRTAALAALGLLAVQWLTGCGFQSRSVVSDPIGESAASIAPGTPREVVHSQLGPACGLTLIDADAFAARPAGSRMVIVPDRPE